MQPVRTALPAPLLDWMSQMPFPALQGLFDRSAAQGMQWYWKGDFVRELTNAAIENTRHAAKTPSELSLMHLYPDRQGGAAVGPGETPWGARDATWSMVIAAIDPDPAKAGGVEKLGQGLLGGRAPPQSRRRLCELHVGRWGEARVKASYGPNFERLVAVKRKYDPTNLFRVNQNISPSA